MQNNSQCIEEDEIDLRELIATLKRRKKLIFTVTGVFTLLAALYVFVIAKPVYEAVATVSIGSQLIKTQSGTFEKKYLDDATALKKVLNVEYDTDRKYVETNTTTYVKSIALPKKSKNFLVITAVGRNNKDAINTIKKPLNEIFTKDEKVYDSVVDVKKNTLHILQSKLNYFKTIEVQRLQSELKLVNNIDTKKIDEQIAFIKEHQIPGIDSKIKALREDMNKNIKEVHNLKSTIKKSRKIDPALASMAMMQMVTLQNEIYKASDTLINYNLQMDRLQQEAIPDLEKQKQRIKKELIPKKVAALKKLETLTIPNIMKSINDVNLSLQAPYIERTKLIGKIYTKDKPVKPKKALIIIVAFITGVILSIFLAFFLEFLKGMKEEDQ